MKTNGKAVLIVIALVFGALASHALASEAPPMTLDYLDECDSDGHSDCAARCITEHNCCIKACNWVEPKAKSKCLAHCETILNKCNRECAEKPEADKETEKPQEPDPRSEFE